MKQFFTLFTGGAKNSRLVTLLLAFFLLVPSISWGQEGGTEPVSGLDYYIENEEVWISGSANCFSSDVIIPEEIAGLPVTGIANSAFSDFYMTSIKIPSSIKTIDSQAFCDALIDKITIPSSVISIGSGAFSSSFIDAITFESTGDIHDYSADMFTALGNTNIPKAIYVPKGMKEAYCQQLPDYADIIQEKEMTPTGITNVTKAEKNTHPTIKMVKNGKVVIVKGDKEYTIGGARIK